MHSPYYDYCSSLYRAPKSSSYIRVFHASPNTPAVDVYVNDRLIVKNLHYKGFSPYLGIEAGKYNVKVFPSGKEDTPVINTEVNIPDKSIITAAAIGTLPEVSLLPILEPVFSGVKGKAYVRFAHLSPNAPSVDIFADGKKVFSNTSYKQVTDYIAVNPGIHTFDVYLSSTNQRVLHVPNIRLLPNRIYTICAVGLAGKTPPLQVVIPLDGNTYLKV
ncbi:DUF4397 domain-containing protein [Clostridium sp. YIM B02515]|uniref:DUF4397 domain-containing protein n=1 Tax=Clostridium rhizosphaerae TaxID=2803861 RepID=A0ABS1T906_9CLOT|nr:DUF4397 domain-containing protein [Clostridium rhizosphaerae]MBL4935820.1 DUF4397 domain-containing protein [Clostridium rhizosphaerae]